MITRLKPLPDIALTNLQPAFYDVESVTAVQMVSKFYKYLQDMVDDYNLFANEVNEEITRFENDTNANYEEFTNCIKNMILNYIESIDTKINNQNAIIEDAVNYMKNTIITTATELFEQALIQGTIQADLTNDYNSQTEELTIKLDLIESEGE